MKTGNNSTRLSPKAQLLLRLIIDHSKTSGFVAGKPETYLGYKECCVGLGVAPEDADLPWGRLLQQHGLNELNEWTIRGNLPRVTGLIVNQTGDRQYWPGGDYFASNGRPDMDAEWWKEQARLAATFDWNRVLTRM